MAIRGGGGQGGDGKFLLKMGGGGGEPGMGGEVSFWGPWCVFYAIRHQVYWGLTHTI